MGGKEARCVRLMNVFGNAATHTILNATDDWGALAAIAAGIRIDCPKDAPPLTGKPGLARYRALSRYMRQFDLVLTYNWGAMDAVGARRLFGRGCPPLIHHEDGFNDDEATKFNLKRRLFRQLMLDTVFALVVPSQKLADIALRYWKYPDAVRIPNGIDVTAYATPCAPDAIPGFTRRDGEVVIGTLAGLRAVKNIPRLVRAFAAWKDLDIRLVIVGEGPERATIEAEAVRLGVADRVLLPGFLPDPQRYLGLFDIFALSSNSEQFPISVAEAMAAGLPILATDVGDIKAMLPPAQGDYIIRMGLAPIIGDGPEDEFADALHTLVSNAKLRATLGAANRAHA
ncbi:MAG: glycosyltransferase, partial [Alphaproteobacteria bacterium]|nr:glycosyltransferase [Alphaproteobacteria bacterium]